MQEEQGQVKVAVLTNGWEIIYREKGGNYEYINGEQIPEYHLTKRYWQHPLKIEMSRDDKSNKTFIRFVILIQYAERDYIEPISEDKILYTYPVDEEMAEKYDSFVRQMLYDIEALKAKENGQLNQTTETTQ